VGCEKERRKKKEERRKKANARAPLGLRRKGGTRGRAEELNVQHSTFNVESKKY
jgi:hypothetical protein